MIIRPAHRGDDDAILQVIMPTIRAGETYALPRDWTEVQALAYWRTAGHTVFVAEAAAAGHDAGPVVGTYYMRSNQLGGGDHVANCAFMTDPAATGRGIAGAMCAHALRYAAEAGYKAMQFNFVVGSNARAIALWQRFGFSIVGRLPEAFRHPVLGPVDALVMYRRLGG